MNYEELYEKSKRDLEKLKPERAILNNKIEELIDALQLNREGDLSVQIAEKRSELTKSLNEIEYTIDELLKSLNTMDNNAPGSDSGC